MGNVNRDPDGKPDLDPIIAERMSKLGLFPIAVICDEPDAKVGDEGSVSFWCFVNTIPRVGENVQLHDGTMCIVDAVAHKIVSFDGGFSFVPNVCCVRKT